MRVRDSVKTRAPSRAQFEQRQAPDSRRPNQALHHLPLSRPVSCDQSAAKRPTCTRAYPRNGPQTVLLELISPARAATSAATPHADSLQQPRLRRGSSTVAHRRPTPPCAAPSPRRSPSIDIQQEVRTCDARTLRSTVSCDQLRARVICAQLGEPTAMLRRTATIPEVGETRWTTRNEGPWAGPSCRQFLLDCRDIRHLYCRICRHARLDLRQPS